MQVTTHTKPATTTKIPISLKSIPKVYHMKGGVSMLLSAIDSIIRPAGPWVLLFHFNIIVTGE